MNCQVSTTLDIPESSVDTATPTVIDNALEVLRNLMGALDQVLLPR